MCRQNQFHSTFLGGEATSLADLKTIHRDVNVLDRIPSNGRERHLPPPKLLRSQTHHTTFNERIVHLHSREETQVDLQPPHSHQANNQLKPTRTFADEAWTEITSSFPSSIDDFPTSPDQDTPPRRAIIPSHPTTPPEASQITYFQRLDFFPPPGPLPFPHQPLAHSIYDPAELGGLGRKDADARASETHRAALWAELMVGSQPEDEGGVMRRRGERRWKRGGLGWWGLLGRVGDADMAFRAW